jgi:hypothetical protein
MLQARRFRLRFPMRAFDFFNLCNPSSRIIALGSIETSTRNIPEGKGRPARKAHNLTVIYEPIFSKMSESRRLTTLWGSDASYRDGFLSFLTHLYNI